jgi:hypothetical protein
LIDDDDDDDDALMNLSRDDSVVQPIEEIENQKDHYCLAS